LKIVRLNYRTTGVENDVCGNSSIVGAQFFFIFQPEAARLSRLVRHSDDARWMDAPEIAILLRRVAERLFLGPIVVGASLVAEAPHVIERLIAIPAGAFRFQCGRRCNEVCGGFDALIDVVCIIHDFATEKSTRPTIMP
jgi:hypothetical protein